ncbi:hypothetical protein L211DRAFT_852373 [Terfezia boudieri ATCC MYA-4762]|uniref:Uncharacterized protein n=1 Tax=Terfezia boudieri ATCC MYA-4762 TaxID=1051890 RepID=A0A3N4LBU4_9PEZI|nr:hypothetical protein L211DRAFT_852373 [Terfezia boudieri ATCC MYA-4762]
MSTEITNIAGKLVKRSQGLREQYVAKLAKLDGPERWELVLEKEVIEGWTDEGYAEMQVDRATADAALSFTSTILPLADIHTESERRKGKAKERLEATWGAVWEDQVGDLMPPWPAEEFLRELAVFSEKNMDWAAAKVILDNRIQQRLVAKKTKKPESQILEGSAGQIPQAESQILEGSAGQIPTNTTILPSSSSSSSITVTEAAVHTPNIDHENTDKQLPGSEAVLETKRSILDESSAPASKEVEAEACAEPRLSIEAVMDKGKGREVDPGEPKHVEAAPNPRKRKSAPNEVQKRRKYGVQIPVINLDVEEGVEELKREALGEEDKDEALTVENAVKMLFHGEGRPHKETARRLLEKTYASVGLLGRSQREVSFQHRTAIIFNQLHDQHPTGIIFNPSQVSPNYGVIAI